MKIGDTLESAIWLSGRELEDMLRRYEKDVAQILSKLCNQEGYIHGPTRQVIKKPGEDRVPPVPNHIQGPDVRLLVVEADVILIGARN